MKKKQNPLYQKQILTLLNLKNSIPNEQCDDKIERHFYKFKLFGEAFPPIICYKCCTRSNTFKTYLNGSSIHKFSSSYTAIARLGYRKIVSQFLEDEYSYKKYGVRDFCDAIDYIDYNKLQAVLDEQQPNKGGRANGWQDLTSSNLNVKRIACEFSEIARECTAKQKSKFRELRPIFSLIEMLCPNLSLVQINEKEKSQQCKPQSRHLQHQNTCVITQRGKKSLRSYRMGPSYWDVMEENPEEVEELCDWTRSLDADRI